MGSGTFSGAIVGLLPGFGLTLCLLIVFPLLIKQSLIFCLLFYCCASSASQYFGSVTTLSFRIPGETTSLPLLELMKDKDFLKRIDDVYFLTSFGSFFASLFSGIIILIFYEILLTFTVYLKTYIIFIFCILGFFLCIAFSSNRLTTSFILFFGGWVISKIGYDQINNINFLTFNNVYLYGGIPTIPLIMGLYAIPSLIKMISYTKKIESTNDILNKFSHTKVQLILSNYKTIIFSSIIGFFMGLLPYVGSSMSSYVSFFFDKKKKTKDLVSNAVASETANNAANISVLIPLIFLGIAIIPSEFLLLEILPLGNNSLTIEKIEPYYTSMFVLLFFSNVLCFYSSWLLIKPIKSLLIATTYVLPIFLISFVLVGIMYIGNSYVQLEYYLFVFTISSFFGLILKKLDLIPFMYAFMLQNHYEGILYKITHIYF